VCERVCVCVVMVVVVVVLPMVVVLAEVAVVVQRDAYLCFSRRSEEVVPLVQQLLHHSYLCFNVILVRQ
jgi:hypothetical protein